MQSEKEKLYAHVDFYRDLLDIPFNQPIKLVDILAPMMQFDVEYSPFKTPGLCGVAMVGEKTDTIILNSNRTAEEQNFDCGHEFLHLTEHRKLRDSFNCFTKAKPQQNTFREWQANEGSAQLLVPYQDFIPRVSVYFNAYCPDALIDLPNILAERYFVSPQVISIRLDSLSYEIEQYRNGRPIGEIELLSRTQRKNLKKKFTNYSALCAFSLDWDAAIKSFEQMPERIHI